MLSLFIYRLFIALKRVDCRMLSLFCCTLWSAGYSLVHQIRCILLVSGNFVLNNKNLTNLLKIECWQKFDVLTICIVRVNDVLHCLWCRWRSMALAVTKSDRFWRYKLTHSRLLCRLWCHLTYCVMQALLCTDVQHRITLLCQWYNNLYELLYFWHYSFGAVLLGDKRGIWSVKHL